jgi:hypothetical protein
MLCDQCYTRLSAADILAKTAKKDMPDFFNTMFDKINKGV